MHRKQGPPSLSPSPPHPQRHQRLPRPHPCHAPPPHCSAARRSQAEPLVLHQLAALHLARAGGGGPGADAVMRRLEAYLGRLGRRLARDAGSGWVGGATWRPDVFAAVYRHLVALHASPAPRPPTARLVPALASRVPGGLPC